MATLIYGDLHLRKEEPFLSAAKTILSQIESSTSSDDHVIFLGDFFHTSRPYPEELKVAIDFFEKCKAKVTILAGNHEYHNTRQTFVEEAFEDSSYIEFIKEPVEKDGFLYLPWVSMQTFRRAGFESLKEYYEDWIMNKWEPLEEKGTLTVLYHFEDETTFMGIDEVGVDLSLVQKRVPNRTIKRIGGHIHLISDNYIGTPYTTRKDEERETFVYLKRDEEGGEFVPQLLPKLIEFKSIMYPDLSSFVPKESRYYIVEIHSAPSSEELYSWKSKYPNIFLADYSLLYGDDRSTEEIQEDLSNHNIRDFLELFIKRNKVDSETANYLLSIF